MRFKCSVANDEDSMGEMMKKFKLAKITTTTSGQRNKQMKKEENIFPLFNLPLELFTEHVIKYLNGIVICTTLRLVCKMWNNIVVGNDGDLSHLNLQVDFKRNRLACIRFYASAEAGSFVNVTELSLQYLNHGMGKDIVGNRFIPGKTIATRGYIYQTNVGGSVLKHFPKLQALCLKRNDLPDENHNWFTDLKHSHLRQLVLEGNEFGVKTCSHLSRSENLSNLTHLNFSSNKIGDEGLKLLCNSTVLSNITHLDISENEISTTGLLAISSSSHFPTTLTLLRANNNPSIGDDLELSIKKGLFKFEKLQSLFLCDCAISKIVESNIENSIGLIGSELQRITFSK